MNLGWTRMLLQYACGTALHHSAIQPLGHHPAHHPICPSRHDLFPCSQSRTLARPIESTTYLLGTRHERPEFIEAYEVRATPPRPPPLRSRHLIAPKVAKQPFLCNMST
jgi:hypothetical protein